MSKIETDGYIHPIDPIGSVDQLEFVAERGEGSRKRVNAFLESVDHKLGSVVGWLMAWSARYNGTIVAVIVVSRPTARVYDNGEIIEISRIAARPERPHNTSSWMIARARRWAALSGYQRILAYAGVAGNCGTVYEACGFECESVETDDTSRWQNRDGRKEYGVYTRRRWVYDLSKIKH